MSRLELKLSLTKAGFELEAEADLGLTGIAAVFGPSGAGKTSLLRAVAGLERRAAGRVRFDGALWQEGRTFVPAHRRRVGYVFQDGRLFAHLDVAGNLDFARRRGHAAGPIGFDDVVAALDLAALLGRRPASLSGGETQRVAIGRALLGNPRLLLMDEPVNALDLDRKREILRYVEQIPARFGLPILYVTHSVDEVARLADTVLAMRAGRIAAVGPVADVLGDAAHYSLAGPLEAGAVLEVEVVAHEAGMSRVRLGDTELRIPAIDVAAGERTRLRVRARDVAIATEQPRRLSIRNVLEARILAIDLDGVHADVALEAGGQRLRSHITRDALAELALEPGQRIYALIKSVALESRL